MTAIQIADLDNGKVDVDHVAKFANSAELTATDRLGRTKRTLAGIDAEAETRMDVIDEAAVAQRQVIQNTANAVLASLGYQVPVPYAAGLNMTVSNQTVSYFDGVSTSTYAPIATYLPFVTSGAFETAKFRLIQGVSGADLGASSGSLLVGFAQAGAGAVKRTVQAKTRELGITPQDFWLPSDPDWTDAFELWAANGGNYIPDGAYVLTRQISLPGSRSLRCGNATLDFSQATNAASFPSGACLYANGGALTRISDLSANAVKGAGLITFLTPPSLQRGDVLIIYNPTDYSFSSFTGRPYYRAGEFVEVDSVSGSDVRLFGALYDSYVASAVQVYLVPRESFTLTGGSLHVIGCPSAGFGAIAASSFSHYRALCLDNFSAQGSLYASASILRCYNVTGAGVQMAQANVVSAGTDYGLAIGNSQKVRLDGRFFGGRHGVTTGGDASVGCVPCRDGLVSGFFANSETAAAGIGAANNHGNTESWRYQGVLNGGYSGGGNNNGVMPGSTLIAKRSQGSVAVMMSEMLGFSFAFSGLTINAFGDPSTNGGRGVIDCNTGGGAFDSNTKFGGTFDLTNTRVYAPDAVRAVTFFNRGCVTTDPLYVAASGLHVQKLAASPVVAMVVGAAQNGGKLIDVMDVRGLIVPSSTYTSASPYSFSVSGTSKVRGWVRSGAATATASTSASTLSMNVAFDQKAPRVPRISGISLNRGRTVGQSYGVDVSSVTDAGFTITISTSDAANFNGAYNFIASWQASVEE